ncbi:DUF6777 domain-containing protein [Streptomyces sp. NPDC127197]|uniref:DUF6777 domain-containing protein n=1 Tax=Streptomyces sp. NPDC127197 TaxID=3345388 RepID=UPI00363953F7
MMGATFRSREERLGRTAFRGLAAVVAMLLGVTLLTGCPGPKSKVMAVGRGVVGASPFSRALLGADLAMSAVEALSGGDKSGNTPGLYGGSRKKVTCLKDQLVDFLKDPGNSDKAKAWAKVQRIEVDQIEKFIDDLTPVVLRNPTLVKNHNYRKGKAVSYEALLEAGIAVLIDLFGRPVVKCNCGNPLAAPDHGIDEVEVDFGKGRTRTWKGDYDKDKVVTVKQPEDSSGLEKVALVDVDAPDRGIERPVGTDGGQDTALPADPDAETAGDVTVPDVLGSSLDEATGRLEDEGFVVETAEVPADGAASGTVVGQEPAGGGTAAEGAIVTLHVAAEVSTQSPEDGVLVPDLAGRPVPEAFAELEALGLMPVYGPDSAQSATALVQQTDPAAGSSVAPGATVTVTAAEEAPEDPSDDPGAGDVNQEPDGTADAG